MAARWDFHSHLSVSRTSFQTLTAGSYHTLFPAALEPASPLRLASFTEPRYPEASSGLFPGPAMYRNPFSGLYSTLFSALGSAVVTLAARNQPWKGRRTVHTTGTG